MSTTNNERPDDGSTAIDLSTCRYCKGINLQSLSAPGGYRHASNRASLVRSAQKCRLCSLLFRRDRTRHADALYLSLEALGEDGAEQLCLTVRHGKGEQDEKNMLTFFLFTKPGDHAAAAGITIKRELSNTQSPESFETAIGWIDRCQQNHICSKRLPLKDHDNDFQLWPSRLVDVSAFPADDQDVRLVENSGSRIEAQYICLSYCWGKSKTFTTTSRSLRLRNTRIHFPTLPKTFRDAVIITRRLGIRYLWIDALCIVQDDRADWERESSRMGAIYSMAYVTIAADSGTDCNSGCFNTSSTSQELATGSANLTLTVGPDGTKSTVFLWDPVSRGIQKPTPPEIDGSPLAERGWVCQERILSPRILHYTSTQLFWECRQTLLAEDNLRPWSMWDSSIDHSVTAAPSTVCGLARHLYGTTQDPIGRKNLLTIWYSNVVAQSYSRRKLTLADDKLTAISGIARAFGRHFHTIYIAGLWRLHLEWGLSWRRRGPSQRPTEYRAPSFSWASIDVPVEWPVPSSTQVCSISVSDVSVIRHSPDKYGRVAACSLTVSGYVNEAKLAARKRMSGGGFDFTWELVGEKGQWLGNAFLDDDREIEGSKSVESVEYLVLSYEEGTRNSQVLLLRAAATRGQVENSYERIGVADILGLELDNDMVDEQFLKTIVLV